MGGAQVGEAGAPIVHARYNLYRMSIYTVLSKLSITNFKKRSIFVYETSAAPLRGGKGPLRI